VSVVERVVTPDSALPNDKRRDRLRHLGHSEVQNSAIPVARDARRRRSEARPLSFCEAHTGCGESCRFDGI
jgi:hypothetical protein